MSKTIENRDLCDNIWLHVLELRIKSVPLEVLRKEDILGKVEKAGFLPNTHLICLQSYFKEGMSVHEIAKKIDKSYSSVKSYINDSLSEIAFRNIPLFTYPEDYKVSRETSIWYLYEVPYRPLVRLHTEFPTLGHLKDSEGSYKNRMVIGKKYADTIDKVLTNIGFDDAEKQYFAVLKNLGDFVYGFQVTPNGNFCLGEVQKRDFSRYSMIDLSELIYEQASKDVDVRSLNFLIKNDEMYEFFKEKGIVNLSDFSKVTKEETSRVRGMGAKTVNRIEAELNYRKMETFKKVEVVKPKVVEVLKSTEETEEIFVPMADRSEEILPKEFRLDVMSKISGTTGDSELLSLYADYLLENNRELEWFVLQEMVTQYGEECPVGVIHFMENHRDFVFKKNILGDLHSATCLGHYVANFSQGIDSKLLMAKFKNVVSTILNRYGSVNLQDLAEYFSKIEWNMPEENIVYLYRNYRNDSKVFITKPKVEPTNKWDDLKLVDLCKKAGITVEHDINTIKRRCKLLEVSYEYAFNGINKIVESGVKKPLEEIGMLVLWFNFNYDAMRVYLSENANFGKEV